MNSVFFCSILLQKRKNIHRRNFKMADALRMFGSHLCGVQHTAIDDARNLSRLASAMIQKQFCINDFTDSI